MLGEVSGREPAKPTSAAGGCSPRGSIFPPPYLAIRPVICLTSDTSGFQRKVHCGGNCGDPSVP